MLRHGFILLFPLLFFGGCPDTPDDEDWTDGDDPSAVNPGETDSSEQTLDGGTASARFETSRLDVSPDQSTLTVALYTNLSAPQIEITTDEMEEFVYVTEITPPDMGNDGRCDVTLEMQDNHLLYNAETDEEEARERLAKLSVVSGGKSLATLEIVQAAPPFCLPDGNVRSTFSTLSFPFTANESTAKVRYYLSDKPLSASDASDLLYDSQQCEELVLSEGQTAFTLDFDGLFTNTVYYLYIRPLGEYGGTADHNYFKEYTASTAAGQSDQDLVMLVSANPANDFTVYLPLHSGYTTGTLDWGDGTVETLSSNVSYYNINHKYDVTSATEIEVRFSGRMTQMDFALSGSIPTSARENTLLEIRQWGYTGLEEIHLGYFTSLRSVASDTQGAFRNMKHFGVEPYGGSFTGTSITEIPEGFFDYAVNATSFDDTFGTCENLASLPDGLFKNCTKANSFQHTFIGCSALTELPADLFNNCTEVTTFKTTFHGCSGLKEIPAGLFDDCAKVTSFEGTFGNCTSLASIPSGLFARNTRVEYIGESSRRNSHMDGGRGVFQGCTSLTEVPAGLFASFNGLKDASFAFDHCKKLTALPADLFSACTPLAYMESTFEGCTDLRSLPSSMFDNNRQLRVIISLFEGCTSLTGESPYTTIGNGTKVHLYERSNYNTEFVNPDEHTGCFRDCTALSDYGTMPKNYK